MDHLQSGQPDARVVIKGKRHKEVYEQQVDLKKSALVAHMIYTTKC